MYDYRGKSITKRPDKIKVCERYNNFRFFPEIIRDAKVEFFIDGIAAIEVIELWDNLPEKWDSFLELIFIIEGIEFSVKTIVDFHYTKQPAPSAYNKIAHRELFEQRIEWYQIYYLLYLKPIENSQKPLHNGAS